MTTYRIQIMQNFTFFAQLFTYSLLHIRLHKNGCTKK